MTDLTERLRAHASAETVTFNHVLYWQTTMDEAATTLETLTQENARLRDGLKRIARYGRDMSGESCAETASVALHSGPAVADVLAKSRSLDPAAWAQADAGRHTRDNNIRIERANDAARKALGGGDE